MARYKRKAIIENAEEFMNETGHDYFLGVDVMAYIRDKTGDTKTASEVTQVLLHRKVAEKTGITLRRNGADYALLKRYGAPNPPDDWSYGRKEA
jgi:hypothetical protein